jgi:hypothetical protein
MQAVHATVPGAAVGDIVDLRLVEAQANSLAGEPVEPQSAEAERTMA